MRKNKLSIFLIDELFTSRKKAAKGKNADAVRILIEFVKFHLHELNVQ
jgi:hypothetical protein